MKLTFRKVIVGLVAGWRAWQWLKHQSVNQTSYHGGEMPLIEGVQREFERPTGTQ